MKNENVKLDSGLWATLTIAAWHSIAVDQNKLIHEFGIHFDTQKILLAAQSLGIHARAISQDISRLSKAPLPAVAQSRDGSFFILGKILEQPLTSESSDHQLADDSARKLIQKVLIQKVGEPPSVITIDELYSLWTGQLIFFVSKSTFAGAIANFDFTWFIPAIIKYRKLLGEVLLISLALQVIGLITPMFFQVVMDKVLVNHAMATLNVITVGLILSILFESILSGIRTWVFAHTSSKIDVELGAKLFRHLLALPIVYFQSRRVGDSVARIRELENIRSFLTGNAMTLVLDIVFSFVFLAVMFWYSTTLTVIVMCSIPIYILISIIFTPVIRRCLDDKFNKTAENQSFLVETINGIDTVKALAVEPRWIQKWDQQLASYVSAGLSVTNVSTIASGGVTLISKLVSALIMWFGATLVIDGQLTVGELVAFNMLAGQVSNPILRLAQLWNDFQQVGISMNRLGDILNTRTEIEGQKTRLPRLQGAIRFEGVSFRYRPDGSDVLREIDLTIAPGEIIGIVGRSGSGKSTLTKLVQRLYIPDRGKVLIDGHDLAIIDTSSLRQQIGVVLQENMLFNRSVRANIALTDPTLSIEEIIAAAKLAGAHEFICELSEGYDTIVGEHGTGLSGGQRQRIAIARALISNPRVLIFDEATSALDYESEKIIQDNMQNICKDRTVLIIAHRLSAVRDAHRIVVMDKGQIVEDDSHANLLKIPGGIYSHLYCLQQGVFTDLSHNQSASNKIGSAV
jgi:ATP-binding cassette, subfamily B, bacterial HlyB/CyaB